MLTAAIAALAISLVPGVINSEPEAPTNPAEDCLSTHQHVDYPLWLSYCLENIHEEALEPPRRSELIDALIAEADGDHWGRASSAIMALGLMGAHEAVDALDAVSARHWHPPLREQAAATAAALRSEAGRTIYWPALSAEARRECIQGGDLRDCGGQAIAFLSRGSSAEEFCPGRAWRWRTHLFMGGPLTRSPLPWRPVLLLDRYGRQSPWGHFAATDFGDYQGMLVWLSHEGAETIIDNENFTALLDDGEEVLAVAGHNNMAGVYGRVYRLTYSDESWNARIIAELPQHTQGVRILEDGLYAAYGTGSAIVFTDDAILGHARCLRLQAR